MATEKLRIELLALTARAEKDVRRFQGSVNKAAKAVQMLGSSGKRSMRPLGEGLSAASVNASEFEKSMAAANARVIAFGASAGLIYQVQRALKETVKATIEVEKSFANINIVLNASQATLQKFGNTLFTISGQTGQSFRDVSEAATELARQGLSMEKTLSRTKDALILTRLTGMGAVESVESLTAAVNSFSSAGVTSAQVINKMAKVDQAFAVSSEDLAKSIARVGSSAVDAGVSLDQLLAITTAVQQRTARGGAVIGNAFKTIFTRIGRTDVQQKLNAIGVATRDMQGNMLGATQVLQNLSDKFKDLSKNQQNQIAESVAGVFQVNVLRAALGDLSNKYGVYNKALSDSASATDEAYRKNEELNKTLDSLVNKTLANLTKAGSGIGELTLKPALEKVLNSVNDVIGSFEEGGRFEKFGQGIGKQLLQGIGNFISGPGLALAGFAAGKLLYNFSKFTKQAVGGLLELNSNVANRKNLEALVTQELLKQPDIIARIERGQTTVEKEAADILSLYKLQNTEAEKLKMTTAAIAGEMAAINRSRVAGGGGRAGGSRFGRRRASGFIPNFASEDQERIEASLGGYQAGAIKKMTIPGEGPILYNSAETVKRFPGMTQPAIMPPEGSRAGSAYKTSFSDAHGFDPYKGQGFVPNFRVIPAIPPKMYWKNPHSQEYDGKLNNRKITEDISNDELDSKTAATWGYSRATKKKAYSTYDLKRKASMLVPKEGYYDPEVEKRFETPFQIGKTKYNKVKFSAHGLRRDASKHLKNKNSSIAEIIDDSLYSAGKNLLNAFDPEFVKNAKITKNEIETLVDQAGGKGARESLKGAFFEGVIRKLIFSKKKSQPLDPTTGTLDTLITKEIKDLFQGPINSSHGDFKANADIKLRSAFASQALKNFGARFPKPKRRSKGFVPSFSSAISEAIEREKSAGIPSSSIRIGSDLRLSSKANPMGLGVYNTKDEPAGLGQGINRSLRMGIDPKTHGAAKGFVPNYIQRGRTSFGASSAPSATQVLPSQVRKTTGSGVGESEKSMENSAGVMDGASMKMMAAASSFMILGPMLQDSIKSVIGKENTQRLEGYLGGEGSINGLLDKVFQGVMTASIVGNPFKGTAGAFSGAKDLSQRKSSLGRFGSGLTGAIKNVVGLDPKTGFKDSLKDAKKMGLWKAGWTGTKKLGSKALPFLGWGLFAKDLWDGFNTGFGKDYGDQSDPMSEELEKFREKDPRTSIDSLRGSMSNLSQNYNTLTKSQKVQSVLNVEKSLEEALKNLSVDEAASLAGPIKEYRESFGHGTKKVTEASENLINTLAQISDAYSKEEKAILNKQKNKEFMSQFAEGGELAFKTGFGSATKIIRNPYFGKSGRSARGRNTEDQFISVLDERAYETNNSLERAKAFVGHYGANNNELLKAAQEMSEYDKLTVLKTEDGSTVLGKHAEYFEKISSLSTEDLEKIRPEDVEAVNEYFRKLLKKIAPLAKVVDGSAPDIPKTPLRRASSFAISANAAYLKEFNAKLDFKKEQAARANKFNEDQLDSKLAFLNNFSNHGIYSEAEFENSRRLAAIKYEEEQANEIYRRQIEEAGANLNKKYGEIKDTLFNKLLEQSAGAKTPEEIKEEVETTLSKNNFLVPFMRSMPATSVTGVFQADLEEEHEFYKRKLANLDAAIKSNQEEDQRPLLVAQKEELEATISSIESQREATTEKDKQVEGLKSQRRQAEKEYQITKKLIESKRIYQREIDMRSKEIRLDYLLDKKIKSKGDFESGRITSEESVALNKEIIELRRNTDGTGDLKKEAAASAKIGIEASLKYGHRDFLNDIEGSFEEIGDTFKSGLKDAIKGLATGADDFKTALGNLFGAISDKIIDRGIGMGVDSILGAGFDFFAKGKAMGGPIKKYQSGGLVTGGCGVKDDV